MVGEDDRTRLKTSDVLYQEWYARAYDQGKLRVVTAEGGGWMRCGR